MEWRAIREAFKAVRAARKLDQHDVAGVPQAMVSKLEMNDNLGPTVGSFVKAVRGLGIPVSAFFLQVESGLPIAELAGDTSSPADLSKAADDDALQFDSEERIAARAFSFLSRELAKAFERIESLEADARARQTHHRLPADARPTAAERRRPARKDGGRHVQSPKKKRQG